MDPENNQETKTNHIAGQSDLKSALRDPKVPRREPESMYTNFKKFGPSEIQKIVYNIEHLDYLCENLEGALSVQDMQVVKHALGDETKARILLIKVQNSSKHTFEKFLSLLKEVNPALYRTVIALCKEINDAENNQENKTDHLIGRPERSPRLQGRESDGTHPICEGHRLRLVDKSSNPERALPTNSVAAKKQVHFEKVMPVPLDPNTLNIDVRIGSSVAVYLRGNPVYGIIRWIGHYGNTQKPIAGIELEDENAAGTDGTYMRVKLFHCQPRRAVFTYLENCRPDRRLEIEAPKKTFHFYVTCGNEKLLVDAEASLFDVRSAIRQAFAISGRDGLIVQYWHQEAGFEDWVQLKEESFRYLSDTVRNRLNVIVDKDPDPEGEHINRQLARSLEDAYNFDLVPDDALF